MPPLFRPDSNPFDTSGLDVVVVMRLRVDDKTVNQSISHRVRQQALFSTMSLAPISAIYTVSGKKETKIFSVTSPI